MKNIIAYILQLHLLQSSVVTSLEATLPRTEESRHRQKRDTVSDEHRKWPGGIIPYAYGLSAGYLTKIVFQEAMAEIEEISCIKFVKRTTEKDYVRIISSDGCYSIIGKDGGYQDLSLGSGCRTKGIALHEILHTLGFYHEQARTDRDKYVEVHHYNAMKGTIRQFNKYKPEEGDTHGQPYDPDSIMHYSNTAFSKNGRSTLVYKKNRYKRLGQRNGLSKIDIIQLRKLYRCTGKFSNNTFLNTTKTTIEIDTCRDDPWSGGQCYFARLTGMCYFAAKGMAYSCPKTCQFCRPTCYDMSEYCGYFGYYGYCTRSETIRQRCRKTCNLCRVI